MRMIVSEIWNILLFVLVPAQVVGNIVYIVLTGGHNQASMYYYLTFHILPQTVGFTGLLKRKHWAWVVLLGITGYNIFDFLKSMLISPEIFQKHFQVFMVITIFVNLVLIIMLVLQRDRFE